jgi:hypothetical protein
LQLCIWRVLLAVRHGPQPNTSGIACCQPPQPSVLPTAAAAAAAFRSTRGRVIGCPLLLLPLLSMLRWRPAAAHQTPLLLLLLPSFPQGKAIGCPLLLLLSMLRWRPTAANQASASHG